MEFAAGRDGKGVTIVKIGKLSARRAERGIALEKSAQSDRWSR